MNRILKFKEKIISYIENNEQDADIISWINTQPELDQPDILRALKTIILEFLEVKPGLNEEEVLAELENIIQNFEESILDQKLQKSLFMMEIEKRVTDEETFGYYIDFARQEVITRIISDPENPQNKELVHQLIQMEKDSGFYNPDNWKAIF